MNFSQTPGLEPPGDVPDRFLSHRDGLARRCFQGAFLLLLAGLVLTLLALWGEQRTAARAAWHNPAQGIQAEAVALDLTLLSLAGVPDDQVLMLCMEKGELETSRALLAFSADLTDRQRMNGWLWLAYRFQAAGQNQSAAGAYRMAGLGAVLSKDLPDLLRVESLLAAGRQLVVLNDKASARFYLKQAALVGAHASGLTAYHRRSLLERLVPASVRAGARRNDWDALAKKVKAGDGEADGNALRIADRTGWHSIAPEDGSALAQARSARRDAAAAWLGVLAAAYDDDGTDRRKESKMARQVLRQALLAEDGAAAQYAAQREASDQTRLAAREIWLRWLLLKRWIAAGGAGAGLVPEWESERGAIDSELSAAWADWLAVQTEPGSSGLPESKPRVAAGPARWATTAAYWGIYPGAPVNDLMPSAQVASSIGNLRLFILEPGNPPVVGWSLKNR